MVTEKVDFREKTLTNKMRRFTSPIGRSGRQAFHTLSRQRFQPLVPPLRLMMPRPWSRTTVIPSVFQLEGGCSIHTPLPE